jgi:hypothetical protein
VLKKLKRPLLLFFRKIRKSRPGEHREVLRRWTLYGCIREL